MKRFLPTRLSLNTNIKPENNKLKNSTSNIIPSNRLYDFLTQINAFNEKIKKELIKKDIKTLEDFLAITIEPLMEIFAGEDGKIQIEFFKKILQEKNNQSFLYMHKAKRIEIYTIV